jgi:hypothetical protein
MVNWSIKAISNGGSRAGSLAGLLADYQKLWAPRSRPDAATEPLAPLENPAGAIHHPRHGSGWLLRRLGMLPERRRNAARSAIAPRDAHSSMQLAADTIEYERLEPVPQNHHGDVPLASTKVGPQRFHQGQAGSINSEPAQPSARRGAEAEAAKRAKATRATALMWMQRNRINRLFIQRLF